MNIAHKSSATEDTVRNRKKKLKARMTRIIDNSSMPVSEKVFAKGQLKSIFDELSLIHQNIVR